MSASAAVITRRLELIEDEPRHALDRHALLLHRSRSCTVTAPSSSDSTSTVTHHGVPISSWRRWLADRGGVVIDGHGVALQVGLDPGTARRSRPLRAAAAPRPCKASSGWSASNARVSPRTSSSRYPSMKNVKAARSAPAAVSTTHGIRCSPVAWSKYSSFSPLASEWRERSKSARLWTPSSSFHPNGKRYSTSTAFFA